MHHCQCFTMFWLLPQQKKIKIWRKLNTFKFLERVPVIQQSNLEVYITISTGTGQTMETLWKYTGCHSLIQTVHVCTNKVTLMITWIQVKSLTLIVRVAHRCWHTMNMLKCHDKYATMKTSNNVTNQWSVNLSW